jgi:hypothetical protein
MPAAAHRLQGASERPSCGCVREPPSRCSTILMMGLGFAAVAFPPVGLAPVVPCSWDKAHAEAKTVVGKMIPDEKYAMMRGANWTLGVLNKWF